MCQPLVDLVSDLKINKLCDDSDDDGLCDGDKFEKRFELNFQKRRVAFFQRFKKFLRA